jgi:hypothetical protein
MREIVTHLYNLQRAVFLRDDTKLFSVRLAFVREVPEIIAQSVPPCPTEQL